VRFACLASVLLATTVASSARAQGNEHVEEGWARYAEARFGDAIEAFDAAEASTGLDRESLVRALEGRALVRFAEEDLPRMQEALVRLASLAPEHALTDEAPPEVARAYLAARREAGDGVRVAATVEEVPGGARIDVDVGNDVSGLVLGVRIVARQDGGEWREVRARTLQLRMPDMDEVEYFVEALGPGGAVVATLGGETDPRRQRLGADIAAAPSRTPLYVGIGAGVAGLVLVVVLAVTLAGRGSSGGTQLGLPMVVEP